MKWTKVLVMTLLLVGPGCFGQTPPKPATDEPIAPDPGFSITVVPPADPVRLGSPINVTIKVENISDKEIPWSSDRSDTPYRAFRTLLMKEGSKVETTFFIGSYGVSNGLTILQK